MTPAPGWKRDGTETNAPVIRKIDRLASALASERLFNDSTLRSSLPLTSGTVTSKRPFTRLESLATVAPPRVTRTTTAFVACPVSRMESARVDGGTWSTTGAAGAVTVIRTVSGALRLPTASSAVTTSVLSDGMSATPAVKRLSAAGTVEASVVLPLFTSTRAAPGAVPLIVIAVACVDGGTGSSAGAGGGWLSSCSTIEVSVAVPQPESCAVIL